MTDSGSTGLMLSTSASGSLLSLDSKPEMTATGRFLPDRIDSVSGHSLKLSGYLDGPQWPNKSLSPLMA